MHRRLERNLHRMIKYASATALRLCVPSAMVFTTHSELHALAKRGLPINMCLLYRHAIIIYKFFYEIMCEIEFVHLNFQLFNSVRSTKLIFKKRQRFFFCCGTFHNIFKLGTRYLFLQRYSVEKLS